MSFLLQLSMECPGCRISLPINGIVESVRCYHCSEVSALPSTFWAEALPAEHFAEALALDEGQAVELDSSSGLRVTYGRRLPRCQRCKGPDIDLDMAAKEVEDGSCHCTQCGNAIRVRAADALCRVVHPRARFVVNESAFDAAAQALQAKTKPVLFQCMSCGAGLPVDGSSRAVECRYCNSSNYLPDGLWQTLHPVPKHEVFFLICELATLAERRESAARRDLPPATLAAYAEDPEPEVRAALAANPSLSEETMVQLALDRNRAVLNALASNPSLSLQVLRQMAQADDPAFRLLALQHPGLDSNAVELLSTDADDSVRRAARVRLGLPEEEPPGFFKRWFGS